MRPLPKAWVVWVERADGYQKQFIIAAHTERSVRMQLSRHGCKVKEWRVMHCKPVDWTDAWVVWEGEA